MGGGGGGGKQPVQVPVQSYRDEGNRNVSDGRSNKKALGSAYLQSERQATPMGDEGFLGQKATLG
jgi:hypothetical protein